MSGSFGPIAASPSQANPALWGSGADGNVTIASGTTTLGRDMHYANLTLSGTGVLATGGFRVFVTGTLDLSAAQTGSIIANSAAGNNAIGAAGGLVASVFAYRPTSSTVPTTPLTQAVGGSANTTTGSNPTQSNATMSCGTSGHGGNGGIGGASTSAGGAGLSGQAFTSAQFNIGSSLPNFPAGNGFPTGVFPVAIGMNGGPGGQGGGDGSNAGGGGGGAPPAPAAIFINAFTIRRGSNVNTAIIQSRGGNGGNGANAAGGNAGGGGAGGGASGGGIFITTQRLSGSAIANGLDASGGTGGQGGNGLGTGKGGTGGQGGGSGSIGVVNLSGPTFSGVQPLTGAAAATVATTAAGTAGTAGIVTMATL